MSEGSSSKSRGRLRTRSVGTKLTEAEYASCEREASQKGQTLSEWCRAALLEEAGGGGGRPSAAEEMLLGEVLAFRKILINLIYHQAAGDLSEERLEELIDSADSEKLQKARERLRAVTRDRSGGEGDGGSR